MGRQLATQTREHDTRILSMQREFDSKLNIATSRCDEAVMQAQNGSQQLETVRRELEESKVKCEGFWLGLKQEKESNRTLQKQLDQLAADTHKEAPTPQLNASASLSTGVSVG